jgi:septal ring factor EnvC (AmiA/AmiB activator)
MVAEHMRVADLKKDMDQRFAQVDQRFAQVDQRFAEVDQRFDRLERKLASEHEETRRHIDMVAESFRDYVNMLAEERR